jgi:hypothetical protein
LLSAIGELFTAAVVPARCWAAGGAARFGSDTTLPSERTVTVRTRFGSVETGAGCVTGAGGTACGAAVTVPPPGMRLGNDPGFSIGRSSRETMRSLLGGSPPIRS